MGKPANDVFDAKVFLAKVGAGKQVLEFHKNQHVFEQGDVADAVFYIQKGRVKLTVLSEQGKEAVIAILEPGQFFGEGCMNGHPLRIATTTAMENCVITSITKAAMIAALHDEPTFSEMFMAYLLTRNSRIEEDLIDQLFNSSERRLARMLLLLANFGKEGSPQPINPHISQETLAEMVGTTRSRVSHFMNKAIIGELASSLGGRVHTSCAAEGSSFLLTFPLTEAEQRAAGATHVVQLKRRKVRRRSEPGISDGVNDVRR